MSEGLRTGEVAEQAEVNIQTLRFYERSGLLAEPPRKMSGYRAYPPEAVRRVRFIKKAQELGFTLKEIRELLDLRDHSEASCETVRRTAQEKIEDIRGKIRSLESMKHALTLLVDSCRRDGHDRVCPILESLDEEGGRHG